MVDAQRLGPRFGAAGGSGLWLVPPARPVLEAELDVIERQLEQLEAEVWLLECRLRRLQAALGQGGTDGKLGVFSGRN